MPDSVYNELVKHIGTIHTIENVAKAKQECEAFFAHKITNVRDLSPNALYYIIGSLEGKQQANFIKENIEYIKENHEDIFIYNMYSPKALATFLNYESLATLYHYDKSIFNRILENNFYEMREKLSEEETIKLYDTFYDEINAIPNIKFISSMTCLRYSVPKAYLYIIDRYKEKISTFEGRDLLHYYEYQVFDNFESFFSKHKDKFIKALVTQSEFTTSSFFSEIDLRQKEGIMIYCGGDQRVFPLIKNMLIRSTKIDTFITLYKKFPDILNDMDIEIIVKTGQNYIHQENFDFKTLEKILDYYKLESIDFLDKYIAPTYCMRSENPVIKYIEKKYRDKLICDGEFLDVDMSTSIYSYNYLKNLKEFSNSRIDINDEKYKLHFKIFINHLICNDIIDTPTKEEVKELNYLFYKIAKGQTISIMTSISSIQDIAMINRLGSLEFISSDFSIEQLRKYNIKQHKRLYSRCKSEYELKAYKNITLKLLLMLGYKRSEYVLNIDDSILTLEHLVGNVDVNRIKMDELNNPVLKKRFINMLFNDYDNPRINEMLNDKTSKLYKYFPRIFNEWEIMTLSHKTNRLSDLIDFLEGADINLPIKYYRLKDQIKHMGRSDNILNEAMMLHDKMLKRIFSSIPRVKGNVNGYEYEVLRFDDMDGLTVGNKTSCCFTIRGRANSDLKHALTSNNGRILVVKKDDKLIAHSWLWRNGNLLCLDNIELNIGVNDCDFLDVYFDFINKVIEVSNEYEKEQAIKIITVGLSGFTEKHKNLLQNYPMYNFKVEELPAPLENVSYSDARKTQYVLYGNKDYKVFHPTYKYLDERPEHFEYIKGTSLESSLKEELENNLNYLRYLEYSNNDKTEDYYTIYINNIDKLYINKDYYIYLKDNEVKSYCLNHDSRAVEEYNLLLNNIKKVCLKK